MARGLVHHFSISEVISALAKRRKATVGWGGQSMPRQRIRYAGLEH